MKAMKATINTLFSIFFFIAIGAHVYYIIVNDGNPIWWHGLYFLTYGVCWWMLFSKNKFRLYYYAVMALFPFVMHAYYGYKHLSLLDAMFWICLTVCIILPLGFYWILYSGKRLN